MEQDFIRELRLIRFAIDDLTSLVLFLVLIQFIMLVSFLWVVYSGRRVKSVDEETIARQRFLQEAQYLLDSGDFKKLLSLSIQRSNEFPHDPNALWYAGLSLYKRNELGKALALFTDLQRIDPAWNRAAVQERLDEIKSRMQGPKSV